MNTHRRSTFAVVTATFALTALLGVSAAGCVASPETAPFLDDEAEGLSPNKAMPGNGGAEQAEIDEEPEEDEVQCEDPDTGDDSPEPVKKKGSTGCPGLPGGWTLVGGTPQAHGDWLYCEYKSSNNCYEFGAWLNVGMGPGNAPSKAQYVAAQCAGLTGDALLVCINEGVGDQLTNPPAECRDYAYLLMLVCAELGLTCDFEASSTHAWVEVTIGGHHCLLDPLNQIIICH